MIVPVYIFENDEITITEVKRTDVPPGANKSDKFLWLIIEKNGISKMTFVSMNADNPVQSRKFLEGNLEFSELVATYHSSCKTYENLMRKNAFNPIVGSRINDFISKISDK